MTLPSVVRIFFALDLPLSAKETLGRFIGSLKKKSKSHAIRWSKPENLHITLQFLAEVQTEHLDSLIKNVRAQIEADIKRSPLTFGTLHLFPNPYRPRVIVLEVAPQEELAALSGMIGEGIAAANYAIESRPFRGHLTIGRIKHARGVNLSFLSEAEIPALDEIDINEVVLFRSEPQPDGSKYTVVERISLTSASLLGGDAAAHHF